MDTRSQAKEPDLTCFREGLVIVAYVHACVTVATARMKHVRPLCEYSNCSSFAQPPKSRHGHALAWEADLPQILTWKFSCQLILVSKFGG